MRVHGVFYHKGAGVYHRSGLSCNINQASEPLALASSGRLLPLVAASSGRLFWSSSEVVLSSAGRLLSEVESATGVLMLWSSTGVETEESSLPLQAARLRAVRVRLRAVVGSALSEPSGRRVTFTAVRLLSVRWMASRRVSPQRGLPQTRPDADQRG